MSENPSLKIDIPGVDFALLARQAIAAKLTEALVGADDVIQRIVVGAMERKVNEHGNVPTHSYDAKLPYIEWLAEDLLRKVTLDVLKTKIESMRPALEKAVEAELRRSAKASARVLASAIAQQAASAYGFTAEIVIKARERS